jgi:DMSO/TMAO reductase YedYZ molybdopterin-dependent catalytic subunit
MNKDSTNEAEEMGAFDYTQVEGEDKIKYQSGEPRGPSDLKPSVIISPDTLRPLRVPPGQARTRKWPVLQWSHVPRISTSQWTLDVRGLVRQPFQINWQQLLELPQTQVFADFHCVTRWSRLGNVWEGVSTRELLDRAGVQSTANFVILHGYDDGFTTNLPLGDFLADDALVAHRHDEQALSPDHGGPVRAIVPRLYAWKSAKWLKAIELVSADQPGYWECAGYHHHGDPWAEERFDSPGVAPS